MAATFEQAAEVAKQFIESTELDVLNRFASLHNAVRLSTPSASHDAVFVPGDRPSASGRILFIAHTDTVFDEADPFYVDRYGHTFFSGFYEGDKPEASERFRGLGADDRAGCAILWLIRNSGHSLLLVSDEEVGCLGSGDCSELHVNTLKDHSFCMQFDRRGSHDLVYYDGANKAFDAYLRRHFFEYSEASGSFSDVGVVSPALDLAGVNISTGYRNEHHLSETLDLLDFYRTYTYLTKLLTQKSFPVFPHVPSPRYSYRSSKSSLSSPLLSGHDFFDDSSDDWNYLAYDRSKTYSPATKSVVDSGLDPNYLPDEYVCMECRDVLQFHELQCWEGDEETFVCPSCGEEVYPLSVALEMDKDPDDDTDPSHLLS
jgi:hypothetical protein